MKNRTFKGFHFSMITFLFILLLAHSLHSQKGGIIVGTEIQTIELRSNATDDTLASKTALGYQLGGRFLKPVFLDRAFLQFEFYFQHREFNDELPNLGTLNYKSTDFVFVPVFTFPKPNNGNGKWDFFGKAGLNTSFSLNRSITPDIGNKIKYKGFNELFAAGMTFGVGLIDDKGIFFEINSDAEFLQPNKRSASNSSVSSDGSLMGISLVVGILLN